LTPGNIATATALTFFALTGFESATTLVDKVRDPARTIPRASIAVQMILPAGKVAGSPAPFADAIAAQWGGGAASLAALAIAIAAFGCLNALILASGELAYAQGLRRDLPAVMAWTWRGNTPVVAQIVSSVLSVLLILANSGRATASLFTFIILVSTAAVLVVRSTDIPINR
jgi:APA family basic amino acid/polyamine antiporter